MKGKDWLKYFIYIIIIFLFIVLKGYIGNLSTAYFRQKFSENYFYIWSSMLTGVCIGLVLGAEHFIGEIKKVGIWKINFPKLILVGLPSLYCSLTFVFFYSGIKFIQNIISYPLFYLLRYSEGYVPLLQLVLGYVIITSFYKYNEIN